MQTTQKDRFLHLVKEQSDDIEAIHLPPSSAGKAGKVTAAALRDLPEYRLQRLFESELIQEKYVIPNTDRTCSSHNSDDEA